VPAVGTKDQFQTSPSPSMASQLEFHPFPRIPKELRLSIWEYVCKEPQIVSIVYSEYIIGGKFVKEGGNVKTHQDECMKHFRFQSHIPRVLHVNGESREHARKYYKLFFSNAPEDQGNTYFNPDIDTCYVALEDMPYEIQYTLPRTYYVAPSDEFSNTQSWDLAHLDNALTRLSCPEDLPDFPAVKFMAVDKAFLERRKVEHWECFFEHTPSLESFTFVLDGNARLSRKGTQVRNWKATRTWEALLKHPPVFISKFCSE
jgi:hypothetical protein